MGKWPHLAVLGDGPWVRGCHSQVQALPTAPSPIRAILLQTTEQ